MKKLINTAINQQQIQQKSMKYQSALTAKAKMLPSNSRKIIPSTKKILKQNPLH